MADAEEAGELALELLGEAAGGQPEVERGVDEVDCSSSASKTRPATGTGETPGTNGRGRERRRVVLGDQLAGCVSRRSSSSDVT